MSQPASVSSPAPLLIVAGETSGDQHGAALVRALQARVPQLVVYGVGGPQMRAAGVETLCDIQALSVVGAVEILTTVPTALRLAARLLREAQRRGTSTAVLIDAPGFNLAFARFAKRAGLRIVYYISPQIWAWRQGRVKKVARRVDKMLTLFPFEVPFYTAAGVDAVYVGHPVLDALQDVPGTESAAQQLGLNPQAPIVALLPGSRRQEVQALLPVMLEACQRIVAHCPQVQGVLPVAPGLDLEDMQRLLDGSVMPVRLIRGQSHVAVRAADVAMVASGTATLETGLLGTPMVVVYRMHPVTAWLARRLLRIPYIGLVNIVAGRPCVPELLQEALNPQTLAALVLQYLHHPGMAAHVRQELARLWHIMGTAQGAQRAAACIVPFVLPAGIGSPPAECL
ncbi:MAG: lipid-A-disaccharide synthase [Candidatus Tectimicrobiota bacterium]